MGFASNLVVLMAFLGAFVCSHTVFTILLHPHVHLDRTQDITRPARISLRHLRHWRRAFDHQSATFKSFLSTTSHFQRHHQQHRNQEHDGITSSVGSSSDSISSSQSSSGSSSPSSQGRPDPATAAHSSSNTPSESASSSSSSSSSLLPVLRRPEVAGQASSSANVRARRFHTVVTGDSSVGESERASERVRD